MSRHCSWPRERRLNLTAFSGILRLPLDPETARSASQAHEGADRPGSVIEAAQS
ncbi:g12642 [Coccomyxa viridis]|uniref:G12642 protein n=1 Tax=Coccomyxa viridis TaxID=1274662 RepID=A0ABP1GAV4_9CHLO